MMSPLFAPLFTTDAMQACFSDQARLVAMVRVEAALARAQGEEALGDAVEAVTGLDPAAIGRATALAGVPVIPFVHAVQAQLPPERERLFHKGATTQDIMDTALVLQIRDGLVLLETELLAVLAGLSALAVRHRGTPCVGRTYGQHAAPVTFGFKVAVWLTGVADSVAQLPMLRQQVLVASLSGPVGTLPGGPALLEAFAAGLGLGTTPLAWHALRGRMVAVGVWLATLIGALAKMATDVAHLASTEVGEVAEPYVPGRGGSSAMPHKRNPVSSTVILAAQAGAPGQVVTLLNALPMLHERPVGLWHAEWAAVPALFGWAAGAVREARVLAEGLEVDAARMLENIGATRGMLFADRAAALLGASMGREAAHAHVEAAAAEVRRSGRGLREVLGNADAAFDLAPAVEAAGVWVDRAVAYASSLSGCDAIPVASLTPTLSRGERGKG